MTETSQEQDIERTLNQDSMAPVLCHMPVEVVSVGVRESTRIKRENAFLDLCIG